MIETEFEVNGTKYLVKKPLSKEQKAAQLEYNKTFGEAIKSGAVLRARLNDYMREQNIWNEERTKMVTKLAEDITAGEDQLRKGGIKLSEATKIAKEVRKNRALIQFALAQRTAAESSTAEGQAENARFQRLLVECLVYREDGKAVYSNIEELLNEENEERLEVSNKGFDILGKIVYNLDDTYEHRLPENAFLKKFNLVDDKLRYINAKGQLIDDIGRRINEDGLLIDDDGNLIDVSGNKITEEGELVVAEEDVKPFLDEEGNPVIPPSE